MWLIVIYRYIVSFRESSSCLATESDFWRNSIWLTWGFAERRPEVANNRPLSPSVLQDGSINEKIWRF